jgi:hypothetical protein
LERRILLLWWFLATLGLACLVSPYASKLPDGLERIARDLGFVNKEAAPFHSPAPDYSLPGSMREKLPGSLVGVIGTAIVFVITVLLARALAGPRSKTKAPNDQEQHGPFLD